MIVRAKHNQSLFDIAIQNTGSAKTVFLILQANEGLELTDQLTPGQEITIPDEAIDAGNTIVTNYFLTNNIIPATAVLEEGGNNSNDYWIDDDGAIEDSEGEIIFS